MPIREIKVKKELRGARFGVAAAASTKSASGFPKGALILKQQLSGAQPAGAVAGCGRRSGFSSFQSASGEQLKEEQQQQVAGAEFVATTGQSDFPYLMNHSELRSSAVRPANVIMQPIRQLKIQSINNGAQNVYDNDDENNPKKQKKNDPLEKKRREKTGKESKVAADHSSQRQRATKLAPPPLSILISSYCFLLACASVVRCAPTGSSSHHQRAMQLERRLTPTPEVVARALQLTGAQMAGGDAKIMGDLIGMVQPIAMLNVYETNNNNHRHHNHPKFSSEQMQKQKRDEEVNISMKPSAATTSALLRQPNDEKFLDDEDEEERQMLLVLASDTSESPSSLRRLIKRSGISDQRLAEIQMIRALKKQLERAATKIAADSTGGGGGDGGQETATKTAA